jgi:hypothetical protein
MVKASEGTLSRKLAALWPNPTQRASVLAELQAYGREAHEREPERVWLAILRLSEGRSDRVAQFVDLAKRDYRDVLMWAESPAEGQALWTVNPDLSPEQRRRREELRRQDRQQYRDWLDE